MDDYGISQAIATGNNYLDSYNVAVDKIKQLNDTLKQGAKRDLSTEKTTEALESAKDLVSSAYGGYGFSSSAKNWATKSKANESVANAEQLSNDIEKSVKSSVSNTIPISNGNAPSIALSGDQAQVNTQQSQQNSRTPDEAQEQQNPTANPKEDPEADEIRPAEPPAVGDDAPKGQTKLMSKALNITDETAEKLGKFGGIAGGLTQAGMSIASDLHGGFKDMNTSEKIGNISNIVGGGAEALGSALDATGVGATVGVPLQVFGGLASLVGGIFSTSGDIVAEGKKKEELQQESTKDDVTTPSQEVTQQSAGVVPNVVRQVSTY